MSRLRRSMHRIWIVEDVIRDIMSYCSPNDICHLGMTCRCLFQIYLDVGLGELDSLKPLYDVLPEPLIPPSEQPTGIKAFVARQTAAKLAKVNKTYSVGRITMYTGRIRSLTLGQGGKNDAYRISGLRALLGRLPLQTCFPQLQTLHVVADCSQTIAAAAALALPTLREFNVTINFEDFKPYHTFKDSFDTSGLPAYFLHLRDLPRLDNIEIRCINNPRREASEVELHGLIHLCRKFPALKGISIPNLAMDEDVTSVFAIMPRLERLHICLPNGDEEELKPQALPFTRLQHLTVDCATSSELSWFMHGLQSQSLKSLTVVPMAMVFYRHEDVAQKFSELVGSKFRALRNFEIQMWSDDPRRPGVPGRERWAFEQFLGLLKCHQLRRFAAVPGSRVIATDDDIRLLIKAWPRLQVLDIGGSGNKHPEPNSGLPIPTFSGLASLAWECPELQSISLSVVPILSKDQAAALFRLPTSPSNVINFALHDLPAERPPPAFINGLAHVILHLFPRLQSFSCARNLWGLRPLQEAIPGRIERGYPLSVSDVARCIVDAYRA